MGLCQSEMLTEKAQGKKNAFIRLLLLGPGNSGKSTLIKQMRLIHTGFSEFEREIQKQIVHMNTIQALAIILRSMAVMEIEIAKPNTKPEIEVETEVVLKYDDGNMSYFLGDREFTAMKALWSKREVREAALTYGDIFHLPESGIYFLDSLDRISAPDYMPSEQDILLTKIASMGITEIVLTIKSVDYCFLDVGGQRSERRKWIHYFEGVNAVIYVAAVSEFDQQMCENENVNRIKDSIHLFDSICNSIWFISTAMFLFLNKIDVFAEKVKHKNIRTTFEKYNGGDSYAEQLRYIRSQFIGVNRNALKQIYVHETCATDSTQIGFIMESVLKSVLEKSIRSIALF